MKMMEYMPMAKSIAKGHAFLYGKIVKDSKAKNLKDRKERIKHFNAHKGSGKLDECIKVLGEDMTQKYFNAGIVGQLPKGHGKPERPNGK